MAKYKIGDILIDDSDSIAIIVSQTKEYYLCDLITVKRDSRIFEKGFVDINPYVRIATEVEIILYG